MMRSPREPKLSGTKSKSFSFGISAYSGKYGICIIAHFGFIVLLYIGPWSCCNPVKIYFMNLVLILPPDIIVAANDKYVEGPGASREKVIHIVWVQTELHDCMGSLSIVLTSVNPTLVYKPNQKDKAPK